MLIFLFQSVWMYITELAGKDLELDVILKFLSYVSPKLVILVLPLAILLSSIMVFGQLSENYEFAAMKSTGLSLQRIMRSLIYFTLFLGVVIFFFSNNVVTAAEFSFLNLRKNISKVKPTMAIAEGQFSEIGDINIKVEEDPEYYKKLSERLEEIIQKHENRWDEIVQLLLDLRDNIEINHKKDADDLGLSQTELAFYNILVSELDDEQKNDEATLVKAKSVVSSLVELLDEASLIVDFFNKWTEQKRIKKNIKRLIIENFDESLVEQVSSRFMDLARTKFDKS